MANLYHCGGKNIKTQTKTRFVTYPYNFDVFSMTFENLTEVIGISAFSETNQDGGGIFNMSISGNVVNFNMRNYSAGQTNTYTITASGY